MNARVCHKRKKPGLRAVGGIITLLAGCGVYALIGDMHSLESGDAVFMRKRGGFSRYTKDKDALTWKMAAKQALKEAVRITLPFVEAGYLLPQKPSSASYLFSLKRGKIFHASVESDGIDPAQCHFFLLQVTHGDSASLVDMVRAERGPAITFTPPYDGRYLLHVQSKAQDLARYKLALREDASLAFPVAGKDSKAILCLFGASRSGGTRKHMGVDIFAPRGTPVVASFDGIVERVESDKIGGRVIWMTDSARQFHLYYAHLDKQLVRRRTKVSAGDTLGTVGNTGNADALDPHLHFGIWRYGEGFFDPYSFIDQPRDAPDIASTQVRRLGAWGRTTAQALLRRRPNEKATVCGRILPHTPVHVTDSVGEWLYVEEPDGAGGFMKKKFVEASVDPFCSITLNALALLYESASEEGSAADTLAAGLRIPVLSRFGSYLHVKIDEKKTGWIREYHMTLASGNL